jgi:hypothetical protein
VGVGFGRHPITRKRRLGFCRLGWEETRWGMNEHGARGGGSEGGFWFPFRIEEDEQRMDAMPLMNGVWVELGHRHRGRNRRIGVRFCEIVAFGVTVEGDRLDVDLSGS